MAKAKKKGGAFELVKTIVYALLIAGVFRTVLFQPFWIPSGSMKDTLLVGDYLFISKYAYGYSQASCPVVFGANICPAFSGRLFGSEPARGDVIVFKHPRTREDYIKRLVGLPGETIQMRDGVLHIDGAPVSLSREGTFTDDFGRRLEVWRETFPEGSSHRVLNMADGMAFDDTPPVVVPAGHYFFMGDNRDNSRDSREPRAAGGVGSVPFEDLVGRAEIIAFSFDGWFFEVWNWRAGRFFKRVE